MREKIAIEEAQQMILARVKPLGTEEVELLDAAGRVIAEDIVARESLPPFRRSGMDGYAIRSQDTWNKRMVALRVLEELPAGKLAEHAVTEDSCVMLMTGAPLPDGADAVVKREDVEREGSLAIVPGQIAAGTNVDPAGNDIAAGETLFPRGTTIGPGEAAVLASQGFARLKVYRRPKVALLSTGDELLELTDAPAPGKIRNSNRYMLAAAIKEEAGEVQIYPSLPDELETTRELLLQAGENADLVISTGGVSMGDYDLVRRALLEIADEPLFWKIRIKPGMPAMVVRRGSTIFLGLSGKPNGAMLNFYLLARPVLARLAGKKGRLLPRLQAELENEFARSSPERNRYLWGILQFDGKWRVRHIPGEQVKSLIGFNALIEIPADSGPLEQGQTVTVIPLKAPQYGGCFYQDFL